jgi:transcriptional regulator with XRE-family HTH domain
MRLELTQEQVATSVGFVPTVYGRIERGDMLPSVPKLRELCLLLGVSADALLSLRSEDNMSLLASPPANASTEARVDSPELRRLELLVRELPPERFRLFLIALESITHPDAE